MTKKGFTLLELLIVIGILAILATAAVLVLNPAELLRQARDSTRASDLASMNSVLGLYLSTVNTPNLHSFGNCSDQGSPNVFVYPPSVPGSIVLNSTTSSITPYNGSGSSSRAVNGNGWIPVNLSTMTGGTPLSAYPIDPSNTVGNTYQYFCSNTTTTYKIATRFESAKYQSDLDLDGKDGGPSSTVYEVGTDLIL